MNKEMKNYKKFKSSCTSPSQAAVAKILTTLSALMYMSSLYNDPIVIWNAANKNPTHCEQTCDWDYAK